MTIVFGPAGLGPAKTADQVLKQYNKIGLRACEIAFTYGVYIKRKEDALRIRKKAKSLGIKLSIHAPYWINLNSAEKAKRDASKKRILKSCEIGHYLGADVVVFHPGYYGSKDGRKEKAYETIRDNIKDVIKEIRKKGWKIKIAPETTGKVNVFGSAEEINKLVKDTGCSFAIDFAHIYARNQGKIDFNKIKKLFPQKKWHCHFSGIVYGKKGEKNHAITRKEEWENLLKNLPKNKNITIINESPSPVEDSVNGLKILKGMK